MKPFLARYTIMDNGHEHSGHIVIWAQDLREAKIVAESQEHDGGYVDDEELTYWDFGDASTIARLNTIQPIKRMEADMCKKLGVAYWYNQPPQRT